VKQRAARSTSNGPWSWRHGPRDHRRRRLEQRRSAQGPGRSAKPFRPFRFSERQSRLAAELQLSRDERTAGAQAVMDTLAELARSGKRSPGKTCAAHQRGQSGQAQSLLQNHRQNRRGGILRCLVGGRPDWADRAEAGAEASGPSRRRSATKPWPIWSAASPNTRQLDMKSRNCHSTWGTEQIEAKDVAAVCVHNKNARALLWRRPGDRDLPRLLRGGRGIVGHER